MKPLIGCISLQGKQAPSSEWGKAGTWVICFKPGYGRQRAERDRSLRGDIVSVREISSLKQLYCYSKDWF